LRVQGVLFNAILCKAEKDLGKIAETIGENSALHFENAKKISMAINKKLWNEENGLYYNYDVVSDKHIFKDTIFSYFPLYAEICSKNQANTLIDNLKTHCYCAADKKCMEIPSYDMCQADFNGEFYWRGPIWFNINWYLIKGLRFYGETELAEWIETSILKLVVDNGFYEYFEPETGKGLGADGFSWTASLFIDLACNRIH